MVRMLIADDENLARYAFRSLISKNFSDVEIVGEAESGSQVIEMARAARPDIIAMDIKMPGINGVEASEIILKEFPGTNILILTAYDNFNYVQKALDIGVKGYLLKPFKKEEVIEKIKKMMENVGDHSTQVSFQEQVENKIRTVKPFIEKELVSAVVGGNTDINEVRSYSSFLQENIDSGYFMLVSFGQAYAGSINDSVRNKIYRDKVTEVAERHLSLLKKCIFGNPVGNVIVVFFPSEPQEDKNIIMKEAMTIARELKRRILLIAGIDTAIGLGTLHSGIQNLKNSYNEAYAALKEAIRDNGVQCYQPCPDSPGHTQPPYPFSLESEFLEALRMGNAEHAKELVNELAACFSAQCVNAGILREFISQFITILKRTLLQLGVGIERLAQAGQLADIGSLDDQEELILWYKNSVHTLVELAEPRKQNRDAGKIKKVHEYIKRYFFKDITLEMAAEEAGLSPQYLSRIFKEETGMNFVEYITEKRINYARELMKSGGGSTREIGRAVGYADVNYFCRIFKKVTGMTPTQYRDSL